MTAIPRSKTKDLNWVVSGGTLPSGRVQVDSDEDIVRALLMDLRDALHDVRAELRKLNSVMQCPNVGKGFRALQRIDKRLAKKVKLP